MAQVERLKPAGVGESSAPQTDTAPVAPVVELSSASRCTLCGRSLVNQRVSYRMVSPLVAMGSVTVCHSCRRAAIGQGYVPAAS